MNSRFIFFRKIINCCKKEQANHDKQFFWLWNEYFLITMAFQWLELEYRNYVNMKAVKMLSISSFQ